MLKIIVSGGGTGGHIFPAIAIADAIKAIRPDAEILFVGAEGRMEMERVPMAGYNITGLRIEGIKRGSVLKNIAIAIKLLGSLRDARNIVASFKPNAVIGVGGYASYPVVRAAQKCGVPTFIAEQNFYAGVSNKRLARRAKKVFVAFEGMESFFPKGKIVVTGNPVRANLQNLGALREEAVDFFGLNPKKKVVLVLGGSLGARTINECILTHTAAIERNADVQWLWQAGKFYHEECAAHLVRTGLKNVLLVPFIERMDLAFAAADVVISRAGAGAIAELAVSGKPCVLVPSPNVAEDHQTKNARNLEAKKAALVVTDRAAIAMLVHTTLLLIKDEARCRALAENIAALAHPDAAANIAVEILNAIDKKTGLS